MYSQNHLIMGNGIMNPGTRGKVVPSGHKVHLATHGGDHFATTGTSGIGGKLLPMANVPMGTIPEHLSLPCSTIHGWVLNNSEARVRHNSCQFSCQHDRQMSYGVPLGNNYGRNYEHHHDWDSEHSQGIVHNTKTRVFNNSASFGKVAETTELPRHVVGKLHGIVTIGYTLSYGLRAGCTGQIVRGYLNGN